jgi:hypothetical protein
VPQIQKVRAVLGDVNLPGADPTPKTDEGGRTMMGWIYFAEHVAPGRILFVSVGSVSPRCHVHIAAPLVRDLADPLESTSLPGFFASYPGPSMYYCVPMFFATVSRRSLFLRRDWGPTVRGVLLAHCCAEHVGQHECSGDCWSWSRKSTKDVGVAPRDSMRAWRTG